MLFFFFFFFCFFFLQGNTSVDGKEYHSLPQSNCDPFLESNLAKSIQTIMYCLLMVASFVGNLLVIIIISRNQKMHTAVTNVLIANMSLSDILLVVFAIPRQIKRIYLPYRMWLADGVFGLITCKLVQFVLDLSMIVSVISLILIAFVRFFSVVYPMKKQPFQKKKKTFFALIVFTWITGASFPSIYFYKYRITYKDKVPYCISTWKPAFDNAKALKVQYPIFLVLFNVIPFILLATLYSIIIASLGKQNKNQCLADRVRQFRAREYRRVTYMLVTVASVFLVAWTPAAVYAFLFVYVWKHPFAIPCYAKHLEFIATVLPCGYSVFNPIIYYVFVQNFKLGLRALLRSCMQFHLCRGKSISVREDETSYAVRYNSVATNSITFLSIRSLAKDEQFQ